MDVMILNDTSSQGGFPMPDNNNKNSEPVNQKSENYDEAVNSGAGTESSNGSDVDDSMKGKIVIDMNKAIELLKTSRPTFYRWLRSGKIKGMKIGRQWRFYREDIDRFMKGEKPVIDLPAAISPFIDALAGELEKAGMDYAAPEEVMEITQAAHLIFLLGIARKASDIHIAPNFTNDLTDPEVNIRLRIDGVLHRIATLDRRLLSPLLEEIKRMSDCSFNMKNKPQDGRLLIKLADVNTKTDEDDSKSFDIRVCFLPTGLGESLTARILDPGSQLLTLDKIDYTPEQREILERNIRLPWGLMVFSGPTGSGKTTNLYACINEITGPDVKTLSIEDPIEFYLPWVNQVGIDPSAGVTFSSALKAVFRSDPDIVVVGEIRDAETLQGAHQLALTGHLVFTQLHTRETAEALRRMLDIGSDPFIIAYSVKLVQAQRLIRKLCPECSVEENPPPDKLSIARDIANKGGLDWNDMSKNFKKPVGCDECAGIGYKRRNIICELLEMTPEIANALTESITVDEIRELAVKQGMVTIEADGIRRACAGETSLDEILRVIGRLGI